MRFRRGHRCRVFDALGLLAAITVLVGCGGSPASPSASASLSIIAATDVLRVGESVDVRLQVVFSDGRATQITPTWRTDLPNILLVKPLSASRQGATPEDGKTGVIDHMLFARVTALAPGVALVLADSRYGSCSLAISVLPA